MKFPRLKQWSIKNKITLFMLTLFLISIWSLAITTTTLMRKEITSMLGEQQFSTAKMLGNDLNDNVQEMATRLEVVARLIDPAMFANPSAMQDFLVKHIIALDRFNAGIFVTGVDGTAVASLPLETKRLGVNFNERDFIAKALSENRSAIGRPMNGKLMRAPLVGMSAPIRNAQGKVIGVIAGVINLGKPNFMDNILNAAYGKTGGYLLTMPGEGLIINGTDKSRIMTPMPAAEAGTLIDQFNQGIDGTGVYVSSRGQSKMASSVAIPVAGWRLTISIPVEEIFTPIEAMQKQMLLFALVLTLLFSGAAWWMLRRQLSPLLAATQQLADMGEHDQPLHPLPVVRQDEIGRLIQGFNGLLQIIESRNRELAAERLSLDNIVRGTGAGTWELDLQNGSVVFNERWAEIIGYTLAELAPISATTWSDNCHPDDYPGVQQELDGYIGGKGDAFYCVARMRHKAGHWVWIQTRAKISVRGPNGEPWRISGINLDISRQKAAEDAALRTAAMLQAVLDAATEVAIITTDMNRIITLFSKGAENLIGYAADEVVGQHTSVLFFDAGETAARADGIASGARRSVASDAGVGNASLPVRKVEMSVRRKDGQRLTIASFLTPLRGSNGEVIGHVGLGYDISKEKEFEKSLIAAKEQAEQATVAKSQFLSNMSHEIRTPMNAILGMLQLLHRTELSDRQRDYIIKSESAGKSLLGLINDILDLSKMEAGKMELDVQPFRLDQLLRDLSVILAANLADKQLEVLFDVDVAAPKALRGDIMRLKQILLNLGSNALKFTQQGTIVLQIRVLQHSAASTTLRFAIIDSGIGIAPEHQQRIFEGFSQAEASTTRRFGGTGLGLSISKQLISMMGGTLQVESVLGQGSTFHFTLAMPNTDHFALEFQHEAPVLPHAIEHVLVVDDNPVACDVIATIVRSWGWQADVAQCGKEAIALVQARKNIGEKPYQAIFMDWNMPDMDGWQTLASLQPLFAADAMPLKIMITADCRKMLGERSVQEQGLLDGFIVKPLTSSMLFDAIVEAQANRDGTRRANPTQSAVPNRLRGMRILLVEDNLINQQVAQELLMEEGAEVVVASNGQLGVDAVANARAPFDAVLMDIQMPVMDGYAATKKIHEDMGLAHLPIIAMTANAMASHRAESLAAGMHDHIGKPFELDKLVAVLLQHTGRAAPLPSPQPVEPQAAVPAMLDTQAALQRLNGNRALYGRILQGFLLEADGIVEQFAHLLQQHDWQQAARLMHTLKGSSATIGAMQVAAQASAQEAALKQADAGYASDAALAGLRAVLLAARLAVSTAAANYAAAPATVATPAASAIAPAELPAARAGLMQLIDLLHNADMAALELHADLRARSGIAREFDFAALDAAIAALDFAAAATHCQVLVDQLELNPQP